MQWRAKFVSNTRSVSLCAGLNQRLPSKCTCYIHARVAGSGGFYARKWLSGVTGYLAVVLAGSSGE